MECEVFLEVSSEVTMTMDEEEVEDRVSHSTPPPLALGCYAYFLLVEKLGCGMVPMVYSPAFFFHIALKFCTVLLLEYVSCVWVDRCVTKGQVWLSEIMYRLYHDLRLVRDLHNQKPKDRGCVKPVPTKHRGLVLWL